MLSIVSRTSVSAACKSLLRSTPAARALCTKGHIPDESEGLTGVAQTEHQFESKYGLEFFDRDAAAALTEEGTKENPIPIFSVEPSRIVGISLEDDNNVRWFTLRQGELAYDSETNNYFALRVVSEAQA